MGEINQEPSMEDILASIKKVIAEDAGTSAPARSGRQARSSAAARAVPFPAEEDVLELQDPVSEGDGLVSQDATAASRQALAALSAMREKGDDAPTDDAVLGAAVREMLKPMLKDWLDRHLPMMVEELVTREIARITGKSL
jgi:hypothetical protein